MKKTISNNSTGIQADGDVTVNVGLTFEQVEKLTNLFLEQNFPKLRDDAMQKAMENTQLFLKEFEKKLSQEFQNINPDKFSDPDVQYSLNEAVIETAKRGNKSNFDVLADLVIKKAYSKQTDLQSLSISEAIKVVARLTSEQINLLCIEYIFSHMSIPNFNHFHNYEKTCQLLFELTSGLDNLSGWNIQYLATQNCIETHFISGLQDIVKMFQEKYKDKLSSLKPEEIREQINTSTYLKGFVDIYEKYQLSDLHLTIIGQLIAAVRIAKYLPQSIDFMNYIK
jgi:hypothetical protein